MSFLINFIKGFISKMLGLLSFGKSRISNSMNVFIKTNSGDTVSVELDPKWDIRSVKEAVAPRLGLEPSQLKLILAGKELCDNIVVEECDLGERSVLHAVSRGRVRGRRGLPQHEEQEEEEGEGSRPMSETLLDLQLTQQERNSVTESEKRSVRAHFYVWCGSCMRMCAGKLRVRCAGCGSGAFTVHADPHNWQHVLMPKQLTGDCLQTPICPQLDNEMSPSFAEFFFKCAEHTSQGERDQAIPLYLIKPNLKDIPCLACSDVCDPVLVFGCDSGHVTCLDCFKLYCSSRLRDRQFRSHPKYGYTLPCPAGCDNSFIEETHHFRLLDKNQYEQYQRFGAEEYVLRMGGVLCPQPGCGMGILLDGGCAKATCVSGCGYVFCVKCLQGYHIGECGQPEASSSTADLQSGYNVDPARAQQACWEAASRVTIRVTSKPCPACRTPTERDGGCMHIICTRSGCDYEWCWVCQTKWTRECMAAHWFG